MKKILIVLLGVGCVLAALTTVLAEKKPVDPEKTIGIVLPMDHVALRAIVNGFEETVSKNYPGKVLLKSKTLNMI